MNKRTLGTAAGLTAAMVAAGGLYLSSTSAAGAAATSLVAAAEPRPGGPRANDGGGGDAKRAKHRRFPARRVVGLHGESTVRRQGEFVEVRYQRGQVTEVAGAAITVRSVDGATWKWTLAEDARIRRHGQKSEAAKIAKGDWAFVAGPKAGGEAKLVVVPKRPPRAAKAPN